MFNLLHKKHLPGGFNKHINPSGHEMNSSECIGFKAMSITANAGHYQFLESMRVKTSQPRHIKQIEEINIPLHQKPALDFCPS